MAHISHPISVLWRDKRGGGTADGADRERRSADSSHTAVQSAVCAVVRESVEYVAMRRTDETIQCDLRRGHVARVAWEGHRHASRDRAKRHWPAPRGKPRAP